MKSSFHFYYKLNNSFEKRDRHHYEMCWKNLSKEEKAEYSIPFEHQRFLFYKGLIDSTDLLKKIFEEDKHK